MSNQAIANNVSKLSLSTPSVLDLMLIVSEIAEVKSKVGITLRGKHGDNSLFSGVCKFVKSAKGMEKTEKLSDDDIAKINEAIAAFWAKQMQKVLGYGEVQTIVFDKPSASYEGTEVSDIKKNARVHVSASVPDSRERKLFVMQLLAAANRRLQQMKDKPAAYDRSDYSKQEVKISALEKELARLVQLFPNVVS